MRDNFATLSVSDSLSSVITWDAFATESFGSLVIPAERRTLPGASAQARLLVRGTQTTVAILLQFSASPCTTTSRLLRSTSEPLDFLEYFVRIGYGGFHTRSTTGAARVCRNQSDRVRNAADRD